MKKTLKLKNFKIEYDTLNYFFLLKVNDILKRDHFLQFPLIKFNKLFMIIKMLDNMILFKGIYDEFKKAEIESNYERDHKPKKHLIKAQQEEKNERCTYAF